MITDDYNYSNSSDDINNDNIQIMIIPTFLQSEEHCQNVHYYHHR